MNSIVSILLHHAKKPPSAPAIFDATGQWTYGELAQRARASAAWLYRKGVRAGDTVALDLHRAPETSLTSLAAFYGLAHLGATILPLCPGLPFVRRIDFVGCRGTLAGVV